VTNAGKASMRPALRTPAEAEAVAPKLRFAAGKNLPAGNLGARQARLQEALAEHFVPSLIAAWL